MKRRILIIQATSRKWHLRTLDSTAPDADPREDYFLLSGETLCQYLLRKDPHSLIIARGPLPYLAGNKTTVGYKSPVTGVPHYSFVGGNAALHLHGLGIDALWLTDPYPDKDTNIPHQYYISIQGTGPDITLKYVSAEHLPPGQRSSYYRLLEQELNGSMQEGSIFTTGSSALRRFHSANLAVEGIYHAGRGGAGYVFARFFRALVLKSSPPDINRYFESPGMTSFVHTETGHTIDALLDIYCNRLSSPTGGTISKLYSTGMNDDGNNTLPSFNASKLGYSQADLGSPVLLKALRKGKTACSWCKVACRHIHYIKAEYAPGGSDIFLDDFEPAYAMYSMLGLTPDENTLAGKLGLFAEINRNVIQPVEEMGLDIINTGTALAALFEGIEKGIIPVKDIPPSLHGYVKEKRLLGNKNAVIQAVRLLNGENADHYPALSQVGSGPGALAEKYPGMRDIVFTCGKGTLGNAGHCNALWTFLMPFSRFFGHYAGQIYKIDAALPPPGSGDNQYRICFELVIDMMLRREYFWLTGNALSMCSFTFIIFSEQGKGEILSRDSLLVRLLSQFGIQTTNRDLEWFSRAFWVQSIMLKYAMGWRPPSQEDFPARVYEALEKALHRDIKELKRLMAMLIDIWKEKAGKVITRFGYDVPWEGK